MGFSNFKAPRETAEARRARRRRPVGFRQPIVRTNASNDPSLALAKGPSRHAEQQAKHATQVAVIATTHDAVWARSNVCETCFETERQTAAHAIKSEHEMNEIRLRSATKGLPAEERFNVQVCCRMCQPCHADFHNKLVRPLPLTTDGMEGAYDVQRKNTDGEWETIHTVDRKRGLRA